MSDIPRLTVGQTSIRLNVKPETVYSYISRGLLSSQRSSGGSTLDALEVEAFAQQRGRAPVSSTSREDGSRYSSHGAPLMILDTNISQVIDGQLYFRGVAVEKLVSRYHFESVAAWLWGEPLNSSHRFKANAEDTRNAANFVAALPRFASPLDKVSAALLALGAADPLRHASQNNVAELGAGLISGIVSSLNQARHKTCRSTDHPSVADGIRAAFGPTQDAKSKSVRAINAALVLLVDHDLAISTLAARAAASARATIYGGISSAIGALDSKLHGNASQDAAELIRMALKYDSPEKALAESIAANGRMVPGFGHALYPEGDPRARILLDILHQEVPDSPVLRAVGSLARVMENRTRLGPNIDLALAALLHVKGMAPDAGPAIFAIARSAGWIAHMADEYGRAPMRMRPHGRYSGPAPSEASGTPEQQK